MQKYAVYETEARPSDSADPGEISTWQHYYLASDVDQYRNTSADVIAANGRELTRMVARIAELERALHQIKNGCVDDDDVANELFRSSPGEIRKIAIAALAGGPVP